MIRKRDLQTQINQMKYEYNKLEKQVQQLTCEHRRTGFDRSQLVVYENFAPTGSYTESNWREECADCGKVLRKFPTKREWLQAKLDRARVDCSESVGAIEREIEELGDDS